MLMIIVTDLVSCEKYVCAKRRTLEEKQGDSKDHYDVQASWLKLEEGGQLITRLSS